MKKIKICFFIPSVNVGGAEKMMIKLANKFSDNSRYSIFFVVLREGVLLHHLNLKNIKLIVLNKSRVAYSFLSLSKVFKEIEADVVISALGHANVIAVLARMISFTNTKIFISERSTISNAPSFKKGFRKLLNRVVYRYFYKRSDGIIAISEGVKEDLVKTLLLPADCIQVINNPAYPSNLDKHSALDRKDIVSSEKVRVLISVGRLEKSKDFLTLLRAINLIKSYSFHLFILGEGSERGVLEKYIIENDLSTVVTLTGFVENPLPWLKAADLYICSSAWEGFGNSIVEAMACNLPVVSTNCVGPKEILQNLGHLVPIGDHKSIAQAILSEHDAGDLFSVRAKEFSIDEISNKYLKFILKV